MTSTGGFNPIKWDCEKQGCWNAACRPPVHFFSDCFPRKISMSDIDGTVELEHHFLFLEWKSHMGELPLGQRLYFERLTTLHTNIVCIIVHAAHSPNDVEHIRVMHNGKLSDWESCDLEGLRERISRWAIKAQQKTKAVA